MEHRRELPRCGPPGIGGEEVEEMLRELIGVALISVGALTMFARVMARSADLQRRSLRNAASHADSDRTG